MRATAKVVIFNIAAVIIVFFLFELIVRIFMSPNLPFERRKDTSIGYVSSGFSRYWPKLNQRILLSDEAGLCEDSIKYSINSFGYRGADFSEKKNPGEIRIAILGGSHVFDLNSFDYRSSPGFPGLIERNLKESRFSVTVINAGLPGSDTRDFVTKILFDLSRYDVDYVVINSSWNDIKWITRVTDSSQIISNPPRAVVKNPLLEQSNFLDAAMGWSVLYRKARDLAWSKALHIGDGSKVNEGQADFSYDVVHTRGDIETGLRQYRRNLLAAIRVIESVHAKPILAIEERFVHALNTPGDMKLISYHMVNVRNHQELVSIFDRCDEIVRDLATSEHVPLIDANKDVGGKREYFSDHVHTTPEGSRAIAAYYSEFFRATLANSSAH